jgi:secondary thiamine-phosphate synthase enzyme
MVVTAELALKTQGDTDMHDVTEAVAEQVRASGVRDGCVTVFCPSSTSALTTIEFEDGALADLRRALDELAPPGRDYQHNRRWGDGNGHAHLRAALLGPSLTVPFTAGKLRLGTWQQLLFIDFDNRPRDRRLILQIIGD